MAIATLTVVTPEIDNTQKRVHLYCQLQLSAATDVYPAGGITLDSVLLAVPGFTTNSGVKFTEIQSSTGSGYVYQRIPSTGKMMILSIPPNGSLTTPSPLQQISSALNLQGIYNDVIACHATCFRNA